MTIRHLQTFVVVYKENSITNAAKKLGVTQPSVSLAIRELEAHYQMKLFEKDGRGINRTTAAHQLYSYASHITSLYREMETEFLQEFRSEHLSIGASETFSYTIIPALLSQRNKTSPPLNLSVTTTESSQLEQLLLSNKLDFALIEDPVRSQVLFSEAICSEELLFVVSRFHPFSAKKSLNLSDFSNESILLPSTNMGIRRIIDAAFLHLGVHLAPVWESTDLSSLLCGIIDNVGIGFLPESMITQHLQRHQLVTVPIKGMHIKRCHQLVYHPNKFLTPRILQCMDIIKDLSFKSINKLIQN